ncbi:MAG: hypothetical protein ABIQ74_01980 [Chitinophagales bacterium]
MVLIRIFLLFLLFVTGTTQARSQGISQNNTQVLNRYQDTLKILNDSLLDASNDMARQTYCYQFIKTMVRALKVEGSFNFSFDSLQRISILTSRDHAFRILNWVLRFDDSTYRYYGTIQMNDPGQLKIFPLFDFSSFITKPQDTITSHEHWFGVLYYEMMEVKSPSGKPYYILFGWDGNDARSNKKVIEVLSFNSKKQPVFGSSLFDFGKYNERNKIKRFILEYKETARVSIRYDHDLEMIIFDHLQPESPATIHDFSTYIPDGTYEGFRWENGKWHYTENVFTSIQQEPPFPDPVNFDKQKKVYTPK